MGKCAYCSAEVPEGVLVCGGCGAPAVVTGGPSVTPGAEEGNWAMFAHLGGLIPVAFLPVIVPLVIWLVRGEGSEFVRRQAREALNFQVSLLIYEAAAFLIALTVIGLPLAFLAYLFFWGLNLVCSILGAVRAARRQPYRYPLNLRLIG